MIYQPRGTQNEVITGSAPVIVVRGGAGTGKTTTAVAAARAHLETSDSELRKTRRAATIADRRTRLPAPQRALFLSFSRTAVHVDVWQLRDLLKSAPTASGPRRRELLRTACDLYRGPLADGHDYEWIQPHREAVRRWAVEAHLALADDLLDGDPQAASDLLDTAIDLDRYHEPTYVQAMHARHALGDADGIRVLERALTRALADLDAEPHDDTTDVAARLRADLTPH